MEPLPDGLTAPFPVAWSQIVAMPHLSWPGASQTFRQPNLQSGGEVLQSLLMHQGLGPLASGEETCLSLLHSLCMPPDIYGIAWPPHCTMLDFTDSPEASAVSAPCNVLSQLLLLGVA